MVYFGGMKQDFIFVFLSFSDSVLEKEAAVKILNLTCFLLSLKPRTYFGWLPNAIQHFNLI